MMIRTFLNQAKFIATTKSIRSSTAKFRYDEYFDINFDSCRVIIPRTSCAGTPPKTSFSFFSKTTSKRMIKQEIIITLWTSSPYIFATTMTTQSPNVQVWIMFQRNNLDKMRLHTDS